MEKHRPDMPLKPAIWNGLRCKCPRCGQGPALHSYLKVRDACPSCDLDLTPQRADDGPPYLTILLVAHIMGVVLHLVYANMTPEPWMAAIGLTGFAVGLSLFLLPRMKGLIIAFQWAKGMGGFGRAS